MDSRRGLDLWGPVGRWAFLNWPRGSWQYDLICGAIIVGLFVLPNPEPQLLDVDAVLAHIEAADAELEGFTADMVGTTHFSLFDEEESESGTVAFLKPGYYRREVLEPNLRTEVYKDGEFTTYIPRIRQATIVSIGERGSDGEGPQVPGLQNSGDLRSSFDVSLEDRRAADSDGVMLYVLKLVPHEGTEPAKRWRTIILEVAEGEWHPARRIVLEEYGGDSETIDLSNVVRNPDLDDDDFELDLPDGVEIVRQSPAEHSTTALY